LVRLKWARPELTTQWGEKNNVLRATTNYRQNKLICGHQRTTAKNCWLVVQEIRPHGTRERVEEALCGALPLVSWQSTLTQSRRALQVAVGAFSIGKSPGGGSSGRQRKGQGRCCNLCTGPRRKRSNQEGKRSLSLRETCITNDASHRSVVQRKRKRRLGHLTRHPGLPL